MWGALQNKNENCKNRIGEGGLWGGWMGWEWSV